MHKRRLASYARGVNIIILMLFASTFIFKPAYEYTMPFKKLKYNTYEVGDTLFGDLYFSGILPVVEKPHLLQVSYNNTNFWIPLPSGAGAYNVSYIEPWDDETTCFLISDYDEQAEPQWITTIQVLQGNLSGMFYIENATHITLKSCADKHLYSWKAEPLTYNQKKQQKIGDALWIGTLAFFIWAIMDEPVIFDEN